MKSRISKICYLLAFDVMYGTGSTLTKRTLKVTTYDDQSLLPLALVKSSTVL